MQGKIINYNIQKGYGFIYSKDYKENIFVHHSAIINAKELFIGQSVEFEIQITQKGLSAISVEAGAKQYSPYLIFGLLSLLTTAITYAYCYLYQPISHILGYLVAINFTTFLLYGYDKFIASSDRLRVPEWNLHGVAILGGSVAGLVSQQLFKHKRVKKSFQLVYWVIVIIQIGVIYTFL